MLLSALAIFALATCGANQKAIQERKSREAHCWPVQFRQGALQREHTATSIARKVSKKCGLSCLLIWIKEGVDKFLGLVTDYDNIVGSVGLTGDFSTFTTEYDVERLVTYGPRKGRFRRN